MSIAIPNNGEATPKKRSLRLEDIQREIQQEAYTYDNEKNQWVYDQDLADDIESEYREHIAKLQSVSVVYSKADSILTGQSITVSVEDNPDLPSTAYNDGKRIVFNARLLENVDDITITSLHGFNYHEVAHALYSPRSNSELGKWIIDNRYKTAYNILEDARIERLLIAKYPSTRFFLETCITDYLLKDSPSEWGGYFILTTGRKYLDIELRQAIADKFIQMAGLGVAEEVAQIIHQYRQLVLPTDTDKAKELIERFAFYIGQDEATTEYVPDDSGNHASNRDLQDKGRNKGVKEQRELQERAEGMEKGSGSEELVEQYADTQTDTGNGETEGEILNKDNSLSNEDKDLRDRLNDRLEKLTKSVQVKSQTQEVRKAIDNNSEQNASTKKSTYTNATVSNNVLEISDRFGHELERLRIENDPMWLLEQPMGRLNVGRAMSADINDIDRVFDRWDIGNDNRDIEAVVLVDNSGSMCYQMNATLEAMWAIKRGVERIDGRVTVFRFNDYTRLVYSANDKASPTEYRAVNSTGGTNPYEGLLEAERILGASDRAIKMLFIISDGEWSYEERCNAVVSRINEVEGAITTAVFLGNLDYLRRHYDQAQIDEMCDRYRHNAQLFHVVGEPKDLIDVATKIVAETIGAKAH